MIFLQFSKWLWRPPLVGYEFRSTDLVRFTSWCDLFFIMRASFKISNRRYNASHARVMYGSNSETRQNVSCLFIFQDLKHSERSFWVIKAQVWVKIWGGQWMVNACGRLNNKLFQSLASMGGTYHQIGAYWIKIGIWLKFTTSQKIYKSSITTISPIAVEPVQGERQAWPTQSKTWTLHQGPTWDGFVRKSSNETWESRGFITGACTMCQKRGLKGGMHPWKSGLR